MTVRPATPHDTGALLTLAAQVEHLFGPMVTDPEFHAALDRCIGRSTALIATGPTGTVTGGLLFGTTPPVTHVHWLVVSAAHRRTGTGRALLTHLLHHTTGPVETVTFGPDHPGAAARPFWEHLGFTPADHLAPGPEGGSRQRYHLPRLPH